MPAGYLREPISNLKRADFIYTTKGHQSYQFLRPYYVKHLESSFKIIKYQNGIKTNDEIEYKRILAF